MKSISASSVTYGSVLYRTLQHARWAVFFDTLGVPYFYEPTSYKLESRVHVPTFWLPSLGDDLRDSRTLKSPGLFVDCVVDYPSVHELSAAHTISTHTDKDYCIFHGSEFTDGLEWWPIVLTEPRPCFFSQCPFCGRFGISSTGLADGERIGWGSVHKHACMEEFKVPERYNTLSHCSQSILVTAHSPCLDIAYETARAITFNSNTPIYVHIAQQAVRAVMSTSTYCTADLTEKIIANAIEWARECPDGFDHAPWWVQHKKDADAGLKECSCYSCMYEREEQTRKKSLEMPVTRLLQ